MCVCMLVCTLSSLYYFTTTTFEYYYNNYYYITTTYSLLTILRLHSVMPLHYILSHICKFIHTFVHSFEEEQQYSSSSAAEEKRGMDGLLDVWSSFSSFHNALFRHTIAMLLPIMLTST